MSNMTNKLTDDYAFLKSLMTFWDTCFFGSPILRMIATLELKENGSNHGGQFTLIIELSHMKNEV